MLGRNRRRRNHSHAGLLPICDPETDSSPANVTDKPGSSIPSSVVFQVSPGAQGRSSVSVPVVTTSPASTGAKRLVREDLGEVRKGKQRTVQHLCAPADRLLLPAPEQRDFEAPQLRHAVLDAGHRGRLSDDEGAVNCVGSDRVHCRERPVRERALHDLEAVRDPVDAVKDLFFVARDGAGKRVGLRASATAAPPACAAQSSESNGRSVPPQQPRRAQLTGVRRIMTRDNNISLPLTERKPKQQVSVKPGRLNGHPANVERWTQRGSRAPRSPDPSGSRMRLRRPRLGPPSGSGRTPGRSWWLWRWPSPMPTT